MASQQTTSKPEPKPQPPRPEPSRQPAYVPPASPPGLEVTFKKGAPIKPGPSAGTLQDDRGNIFVDGTASLWPGFEVRGVPELVKALNSKGWREVGFDRSDAQRARLFLSRNDPAHPFGSYVTVSVDRVRFERNAEALAASILKDAERKWASDEIEVRPVE